MHGRSTNELVRSWLDEVAELADDRPGEEEAADTHSQREGRQHQSGRPRIHARTRRCDVLH